jgi:uncharacterized short protein YbdD (DUF466 family)
MKKTDVLLILGVLTMATQYIYPAQMNEEEQLQYALQRSIETQTPQQREQQELERALALSMAENKEIIAAKKVIASMKKYDNITLILGATDHEKHIIEYKKQHPAEAVMGLTDFASGGAMSERTAFLNFNYIEDLSLLKPLTGKINKIFFDFQTSKFAKFNTDILKLFFSLLKKGGSFALENYYYNAPEYLDGLSCSSNDTKEIRYMDIPAFDKEEKKPFYYVCTKKNNRPFHDRITIEQSIGSKLPI